MENSFDPGFQNGLIRDNRPVRATGIPEDGRRRFWDFLAMNLFSPRLFYSSAGPEWGRRPGTFAFFAVLAGSIASRLWISGFSSLRGASSPGDFQWAGHLGGILFGSLLAALFFLLMARFMAPFIYMGLRLTGRVRGGLRLTYAIICRAGAASLLAFIPYVGRQAAVLWGLFLLAAGVKYAQEAGPFRLLFSVTAGLMAASIILLLFFFFSLSVMLLAIFISAGVLT